MRLYFFRWIFALTGFMRARLLGALLGYWLGSMLDAALARFFSKTSDTTGHNNTYNHGRQDSYLRPLMVVFAHVIHADGKIMHSEMEYVRKFLRATHDEQTATIGEQTLLSIFQEKKQISESAWFRLVSQSCAILAVQMAPAQRMQLIQVLLQIAQADGNIKEVELQGIRLLAVHLGLDASVVDNLTGKRTGSSSADDYRILGISPEATDEEVRQAYRKQALANHPDRVASQGESARAKAEKKFRQITEAKERIFHARGMK